MKKGLIFILFLVAHTSVKSQSATAIELPKIFNSALVDSTEKTERLAAIYFHEQINKYRASKLKKKLGWNDTLWLAARNHCSWMMENNKLSHEEKKGTKLFNGYGPGDRYLFASRNTGSCSWSGENALYNFSHPGELSCEVNARQIADYSFNQWKDSPGHNKNMLNASSVLHGVAFRIKDGGIVWATDLFSSKPGYSPIAEKPTLVFININLASDGLASDTPAPVKPENANAISKPASSATKNKKFVSASTKFIMLDIKQTSTDLKLALHSSALKSNKGMSKAAQRHAEYMAANSRVTHDEKKQKRKYYAGSPQKRIVKASRGVKLIRRRSTQYIESVAMVTADAAAFNINELSKKILEALDQEKAVTAENLISVGYGVAVTRSKNEMKIYVVREAASRR